MVHHEAKAGQLVDADEVIESLLARDLFARKLADAKILVSMSRTIGVVHAVLEDEPVRKVFMPKTRHRLYYAHEAEEIVILAVWGAPRGRGPKPR